MNRREVLKGLGLTAGYALTAPSILSMLQSCTTNTATWTPLFLTENQGVALVNLVDIILPKTESSPGATEVNVPEFLDLYASKAYNEDEQKNYKKGVDAILNELGVANGNPNSLKTEVYENLLAKYLKASDSQKEAFNAQEKSVFDALKKLRNASVWAYKTSEKIGEEVLSYDPIPGAYLGCIPVSDVGNAWSL